MNCPFCNGVNDEYTVFCIHCGSNVNDTPPATAAEGHNPPPGGQFPPQGAPYPPQGAPYPPQVGQYPPQVGQYPPQGAPYPPQGGQYPPPPVSNDPRTQPVYRAFAQTAGSAAFLAAAIAYTVNIVISIINTFTGFLIISSIDSYSDINNFLPTASVSASATSNSALFSSLLSVVPTLLICIGIWKIYLTAKRQDFPVKTSGFSIIKVMTVVNNVFIGVIFVLVILLVLVFSSAFASIMSDLFGPDIAYYYSSETMSYLAFTMIIVFGGVFALMTVYYTKLRKTVKTVLHTALTGYASLKVSTFSYVMFYIIGGINTLSALSYTFSPMMLILNASSAITFICLGYCIASYKSKMTYLFYQGFADPAEMTGTVPPYNYPVSGGGVRY